MKNYQLILKKGSLDEILFIGRNKDFGAFELRTQYHSNLKKSFLLFLLMTFILSLAVLLFSKIKTKTSLDRIYDQPTIFHPYKPETSHTKPATPPPAKSHSNTENTIPKIIEKPIEEIMPMTSATNKGNTSVQQGNQGVTEFSNSNTTTPIAPASTPVQTVEEATEFPEVYPEFPGGEDMMMNFLKSRIRIPYYLDDGSIEGKVFIEFLVNVDGSLSDFKIIQGLHPELDKLSINAVRSMPNWIPGKNGEHKVSVRMMLPIHFE